MKAHIQHKSGQFEIDFSKPIDISIHTSDSDACSKAWYVPSTKIEPVMSDQFTGSVRAGGTVNFRNIFFNPHGNTTHTECVGHIAEEVFDLQKSLTNYFYKAKLFTIVPEVWKGRESEWRKQGDRVITLDQMIDLPLDNSEAIIIRTAPNSDAKKSMQWSSFNWPYLDHEAASFLVKSGIKHLLIDLPSVDREFDGGQMLAHKAFWQYPEETRFDATITELIYVQNKIEDGTYFLSLQPASFVNDAAPCKPIIYKTVNN